MKVLQWVLFIIIFSILSFLMIFYLDLANGPLALFIIELITIGILVVVRYLLADRKFL